MKSIRSLIMIVIGMIAFTATATTAKLEQKQKTELVLGFAPYTTNAVSVVPQIYVVAACTETTVVSSSSVLSIRLEYEPLNFTAVITDVGWYVSEQPITKTHYKEKLQKNYNLHFKGQLAYAFKLARASC